MSLLHRAGKNIALKFATEAVIRVLALLFVVILARSLGDQDYGRYSLVIYLGGLLTIFADLGLNTLLVREVSRRRDLLPVYAGNILTVRLLLSLAVFLFSLILLPLMGYSREMCLLILLGVVSLLGNHLVEFLGAVTNSLERFETELLIKSLNKGLTVLSGLAALGLGYGLWGVVLALVISQGAGCLLTGGIIWKRITPLSLRWEVGLWKSLLRTTLPLGLSLLLTAAYVRLDIILLSLLRADPAEIGWYSVPVKIVEVLSLFPYLIMAGLFPIFSTLSGERPETLREGYQKALDYLVLTALPLVLLISQLADPWLVVLFGPLYQKSVLSLKILIWVVPLVYVHLALLHVLFALNRERLIILGSSLALLFNLTGNLILLPRYGYISASAITVATEFLLVFFYLAHLQRSFYRLPLGGRIIKWAGAGGLMALSLRWLDSRIAGIQILVSLGVYLGALILFRLLVREDLTLLKRALGGSAWTPPNSNHGKTAWRS